MTQGYQGANIQLNLEYGGFPLVALVKEKEDILKRYFEDIVTRDVAQRYNVRNTEKLKSLAKHYITNFASFVSYRAIAGFMYNYHKDKYECDFITKKGKKITSAIQVSYQLKIEQ